MPYRFLSVSILLLSLTACSFSSGQTPLPPITDGASFIGFMIPHNREMARLTGRILAVDTDEGRKAVFRHTLLERNAEIRLLQQGHRSLYGKPYAEPQAEGTPSPSPAAGGEYADQPVEQAVRSYVQDMLKRFETSIEAARQLQRTASGTTLTVLSETVIANQSGEIATFRDILNKLGQ